MTKKTQEKKKRAIMQATKPQPQPQRTPIPQKVNTENHVGEFRELQIEQLLVDPNQPRRKFNKERLQELANSIRSQGLQQPVNVTCAGKKNGLDSFYIKHGERRYHAHRLLGIKKIKCFILTEVYKGELSVERLLEQSAENNSREPQSHCENIRVTQLTVEDTLARAIKGKEQGLIQVALKRVADAHGKTVAWANNYHTLSRLHADLQEMLDHDGDEKLNIQVALSLARAPLDKQMDLLERAKPYFAKNFHIGLKFISLGARELREANGEKMRGRQSEHKVNFQKYAKKLLTLCSQFQGTATTVKQWNEYVGKMISSMSVIEAEQMAATLKQAMIPFNEVCRLLLEKREKHMNDLRGSIRRVA